MKITRLLVSLMSTATLLTACVGGSNPSNNNNTDTAAQVNNFWFDSVSGMPLITNLTTSNTGFYSTGASAYYGVYTPSSSATGGYWNVSVHADHLACSAGIGNCIGSANGPAGPNAPYANSTIQSWTTGWFMYYGDWTFSFNNGSQCTANFGLGMVNNQWFIQPAGSQNITFSNDTIITQNNSQSGLGMPCSENSNYNIAIYNNGNNSNEMYASLIPGGNYIQSCQNIAISTSGNILTMNAQCYQNTNPNTGTPAFVPTSAQFDLTSGDISDYQCSNYSDVGYMYGALSCSFYSTNPNLMPSGNWSQQCTFPQLFWNNDEPIGGNPTTTFSANCKTIYSDMSVTVSAQFAGNVTQNLSNVTCNYNVQAQSLQCTSPGA